MVVAACALQPTEALAEVPAGPVGVQLPAHVCGQVPAPLIQLLEERTEVLLEHLVQHVPATATPLDCRRHTASR